MKPIHSLATEAMAHEGLISDDEFNVSELLSEPGVCCDVTRTVFCDRYKDLACQVSCLTALQKHSRNR